MMGLRFEYRRFGVSKDVLDSFETALPKMEQKHSSEIYTLFQSRSDLNIKLRGSRIDIKALLTCERGFQKWCPLPPFATRLRLQTLKRVYGLPKDFLTLQGYLYACKQHPRVKVVTVTKQRCLFSREGVTYEYTRGLIDQRPFTSVAAESEDIQALKQACARFDLCSRPNQSYPTFLMQTAAPGPTV